MIELLVVVGIIAVLLSLLLPALNSAKSRAQGLRCLNNLRQLTLAWTLYAGDSNDRLVYNLGGDRTKLVVPPNLDLNWVNNIMTWELDPGNTNLDFINKSPLAAYCARSVSLFHCPADRVLSDLQRHAGWTQRVRSVSLNAMVGDAGPSLIGGTNIFNPDYRQFLKMGDFVDPSDIFVFLDEHPDSISDGYFLNKADEVEWVHLPASYHNGAANFTYADGHAQSHRWLLHNTQPPPEPDVVPLPFALPPSQLTDYNWVIQHTTVER